MPSVNFGGSTIPARPDGTPVPILYSDIPSFMGLPIAREKEDLEGVDVVILGIPFDGPCSFRGGNTRLGPEAIRKLSMLYNDYNWDADMKFEDYVTVKDYGDVDVVFDDPKATFSFAERKVSEIYEAGAIPIVLGGDHSITIPVIWALSKWVGDKERIGVIQFDTHADMKGWPDRPTLDRRGPMSQVLLQKNIDARNVVHFGCRSPRSTKEIFDKVKKAGTVLISMTEIIQEGIETCAEKAYEAATDGTDYLYITLDIDAFDITYAPGTNSPSCIGLTSREIWQALGIVTRKGLHGFDFNELSPLYDTSSGTSALIGARFCREAIDIIAKNRALKIQ